MVMVSIVDELLNDFGDSGSEQSDAGEAQNDRTFAGDASSPPAVKASAQDGYVGMELDDDEEEVGEAALDGAAPLIEHVEDAEETKARVEKMRLADVSDVHSVARLMLQLEPVIKKVEGYKGLPMSENLGNLEDNPEYKLLTLSNTLSTSIDGEIMLVHKFIRDHYSARYPELETLVQNPLEYSKTVSIIGNGPMDNIRAISESKDNMVGQSLRQILNGPTLMVVSMEATTTRGEPLSESELTSVMQACEMTLKLDRAKKLLTDYVQSRMSVFAPNLTTLIGSLTAAQLINYAGGIKGLAKTPACNIPPLGSKPNTSIGLATNIGIRHQGFLYQNDIVRDVSVDFKVQAMRILAAKIVLAARVDQAHESTSGEQGLAFYDQVEKRIATLSEAPPNKNGRALPAPDDKPARKRGGRRARKAKEATAMTDLRKAQNRMIFGQEEAEVGYGTGDGTKGMGMIGQQDGGGIRAQQIDHRTRAKLSKKNPGWGGATPAESGTQTIVRGFGQTHADAATAGLRTMGVGGIGSGIITNVANNGGTKTTIAFTPVQGLELADPKVRADNERKRKADDDRWFKGGTFTNIGGGGGGSSGAPKVDSGGFKVPALPLKKQKQ